MKEVKTRESFDNVVKADGNRSAGFCRDLAQSAECGTDFVRALFDAEVLI